MCEAGQLADRSEPSFARTALFSDVRVQSAIVFSGNDTCDASAVAKRASAAANHDVILAHAVIAAFQIERVGLAPEDGPP